MKKHLPFYLCFVALAGLLFVGSADASELSSRLKGKILLQVEQNGEAWYVNPENETRYYLGRPQDAFNLMRSLGLGISNKDFDSFDGYAPNRLSGKILLKVEDSGKAYYVNPSDMKMHYLGRPADAFRVMRELGLGISDNDLNGVPQYVALENWKTFSHPLYGWTLMYPKDWNYKEFNKSVGFAPSNISIEYEAMAHITFTVHQNPENLSLEEFFNLDNQIHYFEQATGGIEEITVANILSKKLKGIGGMLGSNSVILVPKGKSIIEFIDSGDRHQSDKIFNGIVNSLKF